MINPLPPKGDADAFVSKVNEIIEQVNNQRRAIETLTAWLVQAQTGFNSKDAEGICKIVRGEVSA